MWYPPESGWLRLNTDGSFASDQGGFGALLRNDKAYFIIGVAGRLDLHSINLLELKAIEKGLELGLTVQATKIWVESDSTTVLAWVHDKREIPWSAFRSLRKIKQSLAFLENWKATHIHREGNSLADLLAAYQSSKGE
ncbi:hypothetical protein QJS10_CPA01g01498 [Acorus calamus]|uniref:RNase H type-1 domain-containing protein n=1 Tax=Acorus calamus TaxID=4465 RepID=A0AAV9FFX7_ACOCL|nr:hypothetical protein QJS10_CPA01g01498 [Acorus calamus]